jgi:hypothetical protein
MIRLCVQQIEDDVAFLTAGKPPVEINAPLKYLPKGLKEGDWMNVMIEIDATRTRGARGRKGE